MIPREIRAREQAVGLSSEKAEALVNFSYDETTKKRVDLRQDPGDPSLVYGEVTSWENLLNVLDLDSKSIFVDLGSGAGTFVLYAALRGQAMSNIGEFVICVTTHDLIGIEIVKVRHEAAVNAYKQAIQKVVPPRLHFFCDDMLKADGVWWARGTHFFCFDLVFEETLKQKLMGRLMQAKQCKVCVLTTSPKPRIKNSKRTLHPFLTCFREVGTCELATTAAEKVPFYIYHRIE
jgi:hypothetical protein